MYHIWAILSTGATKFLSKEARRKLRQGLTLLFDSGEKGVDQVGGVRNWAFRVFSEG